MKLKIKRFDKNLPLPEYKTGGAVAFDLVARDGVSIAPHSVGYVLLNVAIEIPEGYSIILAARSSTHKKGLILANGIGIVDTDFCGDNDEYAAAYFNFTEAPISISAGERIAQGFLIKVERAEWQETDFMANTDRGGFGSTGAV